MGVFNSSLKRYGMALHLQNPWWLSGASIDLDFDNNRYYDSSLAVGRQSLAVLTDYLSISRASIGYANTSSGTLQSFATDIMRVTDLGLLIEDGRTNLCTNSQIFNSWVQRVNCTVSDNAISAPDGTMTAARVTVTSTGFDWVNTGGLSGASPNTSDPIIVSIYLKAGSASKAYVEVGDEGSNLAISYFDLSAGSVLSDTSGGTVTNDGGIIEALANGWYRCIVEAHVTANMANLSIQWGVSGGAGSRNGVAGDTIYGWGAQVELAMFASSYIPTTSTSATRAKDSISCIGGAATLLGTTPLSVFADVKTSVSTPLAAWRFVGNSSSDRTLLAIKSNTEVSIWNDAVILSATLGNSLTFDAGCKIASAEGSATGRSIVGGGGTVATDTNTAVTLNNPTLGIGGSADHTMYGYIRRAAFWNSRLADATLQSLTAP